MYIQQSKQARDKWRRKKCREWEKGGGWIDDGSNVLRAAEEWLPEWGIRGTRHDYVEREGAEGVGGPEGEPPAEEGSQRRPVARWSLRNLCVYVYTYLYIYIYTRIYIYIYNGYKRDRERERALCKEFACSSADLARERENDLARGYTRPRRSPDSKLLISCARACKTWIMRR